MPVRVRAKFFFEGERKFFIKGVTYGPFAPDANGEYFGTPTSVGRDLDLMVEAGIKLVRIYYVPSKWFLDLCAERGIRALISIGTHRGFSKCRSSGGLRLPCWE